MTSRSPIPAPLTAMRLVAALLLAVAAALVAPSASAADLPTALPVMKDAAGAPLIVLRAPVYAPAQPLVVTADTVAPAAADPALQAVIARFVAFQAALKDARIDDAIAMLAPGRPRDTMGVKWRENAEEKAAKRRESAIELMGCGIAGDQAAVWHLIRVPPDTAIPRIDQYRMIDGQWMLDMEIAQNDMRTALLGAAVELSATEAPASLAKPDDYRFFAWDGGRRAFQRLATPAALAATDRPVLGIHASFFGAPPKPLADLEAPSAPLAALQAAHRTVVAGGDIAAAWVKADGRPLECQQEWLRRAGATRLYAVADGGDRVAVVLGGVDGPAETVVLERSADGRWLLANANTMGKRSGVFNLLARSKALGQCWTADDKALQ